MTVRTAPARAATAAALLLVLAQGISAGELSTVGKRLPPEVEHLLGRLTGAAIVEHARELCEPEYRGRSAGKPGARLAADYLGEQFRSAGLRPGGAGGYYQSFTISAGCVVTGKLEVSLGGASLGEFRKEHDYVVVHVPGGKTDTSGGVVLAGYGITAPDLKFDEYAGLNAKGKAVIVFSGVPWDTKASGWIRRAAGEERFDTLAYKVRNAAAHGASCVLIVENPAGWRGQLESAETLRVTEPASSTGVTIPVVQVTRGFLSRVTAMSDAELRLLAGDIGRDRTPQSSELRGRLLHLEATVSGDARVGRNVVAVLPGRDEKLREECVVLGAHYDHLGQGEKGIFFGANDNAAGVGALVEIAEAFAAMSSAPRRTMVFVAFDAEEVGRLGSRSYVSSPSLRMDRTVLMINFDMIGRNGADEIFAVATRSSPDLHRIHQAVNRHVGLKLNHPESYRLGRSDHTAFYYAGVPVMYLFGGLDPDYNTPRDTWDKLAPAKVEKVARLAFLTALEAAERGDRLSFHRAPEHFPAPPVQAPPAGPGGGK